MGLIPEEDKNRYEMHQNMREWKLNRLKKEREMNKLKDKHKRIRFVRKSDKEKTEKAIETKQSDIDKNKEFRENIQKQEVNYDAINIKLAEERREKVDKAIQSFLENQKLKDKDVKVDYSPETGKIKIEYLNEKGETYAQREYSEDVLIKRELQNKQNVQDTQKE